MKHTGKKPVDGNVTNIYICGDRNKVVLGEKHSRLNALVIALAVIIAAIVLAVSLCCPEHFADVVRLVISFVSGG